MPDIYFPQFRKGREGFPLRGGETILDHVHEAGVEIHSECGGRGECGKCVVRVEKGAGDLSPITEMERNFGLEGDLRLACQAVVVREEEDLYVYIADLGRYSILTETQRRDIPLEPFVYREGDRVLYEGGEMDSYRGGGYREQTRDHHSLLRSRWCVRRGDREMRVGCAGGSHKQRQDRGWEG